MHGTAVVGLILRKSNVFCESRVKENITVNFGVILSNFLLGATFAPLGAPGSLFTSALRFLVQRSSVT